MARGILTGLSEGKILAGNASAVSGLDWRRKIVSTGGNAVDSIPFDARKDLPHSCLFLFPPDSRQKGDLLFAVSDYNFTNFRLRTFSSSFIYIPPFGALQVKPFRSFDETLLYAGTMESDSVFRRNIPPDIIPLVISDVNLDLLEKGKPLDEYISFYRTELSNGQPLPPRTLPDSLRSAVPVKGIEDVHEPEKVVSLEEEKTKKPPIVPQQSGQPTIGQRRAELERRAEEALQQTETALSKKERAGMLKERERERKALLKQRERELKEREKARKDEWKRHERERQQKLKELERLRKEKRKESERLLR